MDEHAAAVEFSRIAALPDHEIEVGTAALLIASGEYPELDLAAELRTLDSLADAALPLAGNDGDPLYSINRLSEYLFDELGFRGNEEDYYDPRNSYLNEVLSRRRGIPITLSLLYIEVGKRLGLPLLGVGMPGHFLVRHAGVDDLFIDPFNGGILLSAEECAQLLSRIDATDRPWGPHYLDPITNREFVARMLRNLKTIYWENEDQQRSLRALDWLVALEPNVTRDLMERGIVNYRLGRLREALSDLRGYVASEPADPELAAVEELVGRIKRSLG